jgi:toluene monooxygenase system protein E
MRRIQRIAYRAKSLSLEFGEELADTQTARTIWEEDPSWQPLRKVLEEMLVAYDLGECFAALNLVVKPLYDGLFIDALSQTAGAEGDEELALTLDDLRLDSDRNKDWTKALVAYAVSQRPENREVLDGWIEKWRPRTEEAVAAAAAMLADRQWPDSGVEREQVAAAGYEAFLAECGLQTAQAV